MSEAVTDRSSETKLDLNDDSRIESDENVSEDNQTVCSEKKIQMLMLK